MKQLVKIFYFSTAIMLYCTVTWYFYGQPAASIVCLCIGFINLCVGTYFLVKDKRNKSQADKTDKDNR